MGTLSGFPYQRAERFGALALDTKQKIRGRLIRSWKGILLKLFRRCPAKISHAQGTRLGKDVGLIKGEVHRISIVLVRPLRHTILDLHIHTHPLLQLPLERRFVGLAGLNLASGKLPKPWQNGRRPSLGNEIATLAFNNSCYQPDMWP
jgi:hypothetical protein